MNKTFLKWVGNKTKVLPHLILHIGYPKHYCSPTRTTLGGLLGGGIAAAVSKSDSYGWSVPLGAVLGLGTSQIGCY